MAPPAQRTRPLRELDIAVVGGSIAGCTAAIELARLGCKVTLFERSGEELKDRGAGLGVPASVIATFITRDLIDADLPYFPAPAFLRICRTAQEPRYGRLAWAQPATLAALNWGGLFRNLRKRVPAGVYRTRQQVTALALRHHIPGDVLHRVEQFPHQMRRLLPAWLRPAVEVCPYLRTPSAVRWSMTACSFESSSRLHVSAR